LCTKQIDGNYHLDASPSLLCYDSTWYSYLPFLIICLVVYALLFPTVTFYLVYKHRNAKNDSLMWDRYSSLFSPFKDSYWWWMAFLKARKLSLVLAQLGNNKILSITLSFIFVSMAMFAHFHVNPYFIKRCNLLEQGTLTVWLFFLFCMLVWAQSSVSASMENALGVLTIIICAFTALACFSYICWDLRLMRTQVGDSWLPTMKFFREKVKPAFAETETTETETETEMALEDTTQDR